MAALLDARRGEVYAALFPDGAEERVYTPEELAPRLPEGCAVVVGEGAGPVAKRLEELCGGGIELLPESLGRALGDARVH